MWHGAGHVQPRDGTFCLKEMSIQYRFNPTSGIPTPGGGNKGATGKPLTDADSGTSFNESRGGVEGHAHSAALFGGTSNRRISRPSGYAPLHSVSLRRKAGIESCPRDLSLPSSQPFAMSGKITWFSTTGEVTMAVVDNVRRNVRAWHQRNAKRCRVRAEAIRIKLTNPMAKVHPLHNVAHVEMGRLLQMAHRYTQLAGQV